MTIMDTLRTIFGRTSSGPSKRTAEKVDAAIQAADELTQQSREINNKLKGYLDERDPFTAFLIDISNEKARRKQNSQWDQ